jgi:hypothetical protein
MNCDNYNNNNDFITKSYDIKIYTLVIIIIKIEIQTKNNNILNIYNDKSIDLIVHALLSFSKRKV